jgi:hypothetical protein
MEGITILNQFVVDKAPVGWFAIIAGAMLCSICLWGMFVMFADGNPGAATAFIILALICVGLITLGICVVKTHPETQYQVIIDESVSMSEFFEKYEIIEQEGKIYTVKEKGQ